MADRLNAALSLSVATGTLPSSSPAVEAHHRRRTASITASTSNVDTAPPDTSTGIRNEGTNSSKDTTGSNNNDEDDDDDEEDKHEDENGRSEEPLEDESVQNRSDDR